MNVPETKFFIEHVFCFDTENDFKIKRKVDLNKAEVPTWNDCMKLSNH